MFDSMVVMPLLVLNMGSEMIYILCQRLGAQNIGLDKKARGAHALNYIALAVYIALRSQSCTTY